MVLIKRFALALAVVASSAIVFAQSGPTAAAIFHVICDSGCSGSVGTLDGGTFTAGSSGVNLAAGVYDDSLPGLAAPGISAARLDAFRSLHVSLYDVNGTRLGDSLSPLWVQGELSMVDSGANRIDGAASAPAGTERGLIVRNIPSGTQAVSGTFWQATQPVSLASVPSHNVTNAGTFAVQVTSAPTTAVTGTFWQATQPVSGTVTANQGGTWTSTAPTITKGTQGSTGYTVQALKDAGRTLVTLTADAVTPVLTTDTLVTVTKLVGDTSTASVTTYPVTSGKTLRLLSLTFNMVPTSTTAANLRVRLRTNSGGTCTASSALVGVWGTSSPPGTLAANAGGLTAVTVPFPDGLEFSGATRNICLSMNVLGAAAQTVNITLTGFEY